MSKKTMFCKSCREKEIEPFLGYMTFCNSDEICPYCKTELQELDFPADDFNFLRNQVSKDINFLESMIKLRQENIIDYQMKLSQFKSQVGQQESSRVQTDNRPKCPHCNSTNIKSISGLERVGSIAMWGLFSKKINKSFKCNHCGYTW